MLTKYKLEDFKEWINADESKKNILLDCLIEDTIEEVWEDWEGTKWNIYMKLASYEEIASEDIEGNFKPVWKLLQEWKTKIDKENK
jgi:hypothetical protein